MKINIKDLSYKLEELEILRNELKECRELSQNVNRNFNSDTTIHLKIYDGSSFDYLLAKTTLGRLILNSIEDTINERSTFLVKSIENLEL